MEDHTGACTHRGDDRRVAHITCTLGTTTTPAQLMATLRKMRTQQNRGNNPKNDYRVSIQHSMKHNTYEMSHTQRIASNTACITLDVFHCWEASKTKSSKCRNRICPRGAALNPQNFAKHVSLPIIKCTILLFSNSEISSHSKKVHVLISKTGSI